MNLKMRLTTVVALLAIFTLTRAQETTPTMHLTLDKAIELALSENPTIKVAEKEIELKKVSQNEAWMNLLPTASLTGSLNYTIKAAEMNFNGEAFKMGKDDASTWNGTLQVSLPIFAPAIYKTMSLTKADVELAAEKSRGSKIDMVNQVTKAYYQLLLAQDSYEVLMQNYKLAEDNFNIVNAKFQQGSVSEYVEKLPRGYDTPLMRIFEQDGTELSGGQWQKIAVARAFYSDSDILILDEPTAALDAIAEQEIFNQFDRLREDKTTIFVSHRLSSATVASLIVVLEYGRVIETGTHRELMDRKGRYHELFSTQAKRYIEGE